MADGKWGEFRRDDGQSRPFGGGTARDVVAEVVARRDGWVEIRPGHWAEAGAVIEALRTAGFPTRKGDRIDMVRLR